MDISSDPQCAWCSGSLHTWAESEHWVNFSTAAAAQQRPMSVRYAEAKGGGLIADWSLSFPQSSGLEFSGSATANSCFIMSLRFNYFSNSHPLCIQGEQPKGHTLYLLAADAKQTNMEEKKRLDSSGKNVPHFIISSARPAHTDSSCKHLILTFDLLDVRLQRWGFIVSGNNTCMISIGPER